MPFNGHTPRQHRAASAKGGKRRMKRVTHDQQREWGKRGGLASQARLRRIRESVEAHSMIAAQEAEGGADDDGGGLGPHGGRKEPEPHEQG